MCKSISIIFILLNAVCINNTMAQCRATPIFTPKAVAEITDVFQFTFLHYPLVNRLDSLVFQLNYPMYVTDSNMFDWRKYNGKGYLDAFDYEKAINEIGKHQTQEAFFILQLPYVFSENAQYRNMHVVDDISPFNSLLSMLGTRAGAKAINKYYLASIVSDKLNDEEFILKVMTLSKPKRQVYNPKQQHFNWIKYCQPLRGDDYSLALMKKIDASQCDSAIVKVINKYTNNNTVNKNYYSLDSIMIAIFADTNVIDAQADNCVPQVSADNGISYTRIGVIYKTKPLYPWDNYSTVLRVYTIENNVYKGQRISNIDYSINFISNTRKLCNGEE